MSCNRTVVVDPSAISRQSVGERSATDWRSVGDWLATVFWAFVFDCKISATFWRSVGNQSATRRQPVGDHQNPFYDRFGCREVSLAATKTSLRLNRPCNLLQTVGVLATTPQPPSDHPKFWSQGGRRPVANYVWPGLYQNTHAFSSGTLLCFWNIKAVVSSHSLMAFHKMLLCKSLIEVFHKSLVTRSLYFMYTTVIPHASWFHLSQ